MIALPSGVRVWIAAGHTDMRRGMQGLARQVQERAAIVLTLIQTAKLNNVDPQAWLADVLGRINDHSIHGLDRLLPWNWKMSLTKLAA